MMKTLSGKKGIKETRNIALENNSFRVSLQFSSHGYDAVRNAQE